MSRIKDLVGMRFGRLVVKELADRPEGEKHRGAWWLCSCDCGNHKPIRSSALLSNKGTRSCGCLLKEKPETVKKKNKYASVRKDETKPRLQRIFSNRRRDSKKNNVPFDIQYSDLPPVPEKCPVLGITLEWGNKNGTDNSPSLDRIIPELGYVKGNIVWISLRANILKRDANISEIEKLYMWLKNTLSEKELL